MAKVGRDVAGHNWHDLRVAQHRARYSFSSKCFFRSSDCRVAHSPIKPSVRASQIGKSVPHSSRLYRDEWAASSCCPLRLDFNDSSNSTSVVDTKMSGPPSAGQLFEPGKPGALPLDQLYAPVLRFAILSVIRCDWRVESAAKRTQPIRRNTVLRSQLANH
jgi:hypothetical protein